MNKTSLSLCAAISLLSVSAEATILVSGEYLEIADRVSEPLHLVNGARVTMRDGEIVAPAQGLPNTGTVTMEIGTSAIRNTFEMEGHSFLTSTTSVPIMMHVLSTVRLTDDALVVARNGNAIQSRGGSPSNTVYLEDHAIVVGNVAMDGVMNISGQARITGRLSEGNGNTRLFMSGGSIDGGVVLTSAGDYAAEIGGGRIDNGFRLGFSSGAFFFTMTGGEIYGGFTAQGSLNDANIFGGSIFGGLHLNAFAPLSIWGGNVNAVTDGWLIDTLDFSHNSNPRQLVSIYGGQIGQLDAGRGIHLTEFNGLDVYGYDLNLTNGVLSGYLSDGHWLSVGIVTDANWAGAINLYDVRNSVPEPSTAFLFLTAAGGMFGFRRRKAAGS